MKSDLQRASDRQVDEMRDKDVDRERAINSRRDVAVVALRDQIGRILMVRTTRLPSRWQPIGGGVDPEDDGPTGALIREAREEAHVDLRCEDLRAVTEEPYDFGNGTVYCFEAYVENQIEDLELNREEIVEHGWFTVLQARDLPVFPATKRFLDLLV